MIITIRLYNKEKEVIKRLIIPRSKWKRGQYLLNIPAYKYYIEVLYDQDKTVSGKMETFKNEYEGFCSQKAKDALSAFIES